MPRAATLLLALMLALPAAATAGEPYRVVVLGVGGSSLGARALFEALCHTYHNDLPPEKRLGTPRLYFEGDNVDNDALHDLLDLLENCCVDPEVREERP